MRNWFKIHKEELKNTIKADKEAKEECIVESRQDIVVIDDVEYIWVEGYKGTDKYMSCTYTNHYFFSGITSRLYTQQYLLNECVTFDDIPKTGQKGFHFCVELEDVFTWYPYNFKRRYFRVKALVRKDEWEENNHKGKFAAKTIILTEEVFLTFEDLAKYDDEYKEYIFHAEYKDDYLPIGKELFETLKQKETVNFDYLWRTEFFISMKQFGYSDLFVQLLFDKADGYSRQKEIRKVAKALHEEAVSGDIAIYLLMKELNK